MYIQWIENLFLDSYIRVCILDALPIDYSLSARRGLSSQQLLSSRFLRSPPTLTHNLDLRPWADMVKVNQHAKLSSSNVI